MLIVIHEVSSLSDIIEISILGHKTTAVMIPVLLSHMKGTLVTLPPLIVLISAATTFLQADIMTYNISTLVVQNTGYIQEKMPQI